jgi:hypothetical protein
MGEQAEHRHRQTDRQADTNKRPQTDETLTACFVGMHQTKQDRQTDEQTGKVGRSVDR